VLSKLIQRNLKPGSAARRSAERWVIECPRCRHAAPALERGITRVAAASKGKRVLAKCTNCKRLTFARLYEDETKADALRIQELESELGV